MTVYLVDGSISRNEDRKASVELVNEEASLEQELCKPFSASLAALRLPVGRLGKSRLMTRGFISSTILKVPAEERFELASRDMAFIRASHDGRLTRRIDP